MQELHFPLECQETFCVQSHTVATPGGPAEAQLAWRVWDPPKDEPVIQGTRNIVQKALS